MKGELEMEESQWSMGWNAVDVLDRGGVERRQLACKGEIRTGGDERGVVEW